MFWKWKSTARYVRVPSRARGTKKSIWSTSVRPKQIAIPTMKATIWLRVRAEASRPMAENAAPSSRAPR